MTRLPSAPGMTAVTTGAAVLGAAFLIVGIMSAVDRQWLTAAGGLLVALMAGAALVALRASGADTTRRRRAMLAVYVIGAIALIVNIAALFG